MEISFIHKISKGSRFNQIYVPKEKGGLFEVGDIVEVKLLKKSQQLYYSKNLKINDFKEYLIKQLFSCLSNFSEIKQIFIVGSFLTKPDYKDIDLLLITDKIPSSFEQKILFLLTAKFETSFHLLFFPQETFSKLKKTCPLTRSMLSSFVSNKKFSLPSQETDKSHINFLLMMPRDLLELAPINSRVFFDNLRRLVTIQRFLAKKDLNQLKIEQEPKNLLGESLFFQLKDNQQITQKNMEKIKSIIKLKLKIISKKLKNE